MDFPVVYVCLVSYVAVSFEEKFKMVIRSLYAVPRAGRIAVFGPGSVGVQGYCAWVQGFCPFLMLMPLGLFSLIADFRGCEEEERIVRRVFQNCVKGDDLDQFRYRPDSTYGFVRLWGGEGVLETWFVGVCVRCH